MPLTQKTVMNLLVEASSSATSWIRRNEIQCELVSALVNDEDGREDGIQVVLESLYVDCIQNNPAMLPTLFPFFAKVCCASDNQLVGDVDWSLARRK